MLTFKHVTAGDCTFTVEIPQEYQQGKPHYTYRVQEAEKPAYDGSKTYFVKLLTGPDNSNDFSYIGLFGSHSTFRTTAKSFLQSSAFPVRLLDRILAALATDPTRIEATGFKVHHEGKCCRCNRKLTTPQSVEDGIGPECKIIAGW